MSFRTRLTSFFLLIVVVPMMAVGFLAFRLIGDSSQGKADARANGLATASVSLYGSKTAEARTDATTVARDPALLSGSSLSARLGTFAVKAGLSRVTVSEGAKLLADVGDHNAIAPGVATVKRGRGLASITIRVSAIDASEYVRELGSPPSVQVVVRQGGQVLGATSSVGANRSFPRRGSVSLGGSSYRDVTETFAGFGPRPVEVTVLSNASATGSSMGTSRLVAGIFILGFLLLALSFSILSSRALHGQISRFLEAARRLGSGDFSAQIPTEGNDEFAALGAEFNSMSSELERRLDELSQERMRLRASIRRIGQTFAANLDRPALLELALKTSVDAVQGSWGRVSARTESGEPLGETTRVGDLTGVAEVVFDAERAALASGSYGESRSNGLNVASVALGGAETGTRPHGLITVGRVGRPFSDDDRDLLRSLAAQATLALENVDLHHQVSRQAITDDLTGLANHGRFQDLLSAEIEQVRRYHHPVGLIMIDIDDFKSVNDSYGHQQGDVVLSYVARVLRDTSREPDTPARYGGEEMALVLPHTDLEGSYVIAERIRGSIAALRIPRLDRQGTLRVTASLGVAASSDGHKDALIAEADRALYGAKREGKNRVMKAQPETANVFGGE